MHSLSSRLSHWLIHIGHHQEPGDFRTGSKGSSERTNEYECFEHMVTVESEQNSQVINVSVQSTDAALASNLANSIAEVFSSDVQELMSVDNVTVLSTSGIPTSPVSPNIILTQRLQQSLDSYSVSVLLSYVKYSIVASGQKIRSNKFLICRYSVVSRISTVKYSSHRQKQQNERRSNNMAKKSKMNKTHGN